MRLPSRASPLQRYLSFLLLITLAVVIAEQLFQLYFLNTTGRAEARRALAARPALQERLGQTRLGFAWRGHTSWWIPGPATAIMYIPVQGEHRSGTLYVREEGQAGNWTLRRISFRDSSSQIWTVY